ncbi:hypothetical protein [Xenorhabdus sp. KK7.4]|uniref:hypothetical protein n=1 Tax=Xenorhabdus sp. KK7.4 TaxID=1851572 RepID=UPI000C05D108|nr:hypothetical protein [Xenorhabdus sp. KK7.4]PHM52456.1 hypothetical protein Xekk_03133 [Xenorhabdus sp. KK7.4]
MDNEIIIKRENYLNQIKQAEQFFCHNIEDHFTLSDHRFSDADGLVQFVIASQLNDKSNVMKKMDDIKKTQIALSSIATDYIIRYSDTRGRQYRTDVQFWGDIMGKLPLMSVRNIEKQTYQHVMKGFSIATNLLQLIMDIVVNNNIKFISLFLLVKYSKNKSNCPVYCPVYQKHLTLEQYFSSSILA